MSFIRNIDRLNNLIGKIVAVMLGVMTVVVLLQVVSRFVLTLPISWSEELSRYLMIYITMLAAALAYRTNSLVAITILAEFINFNKKRILSIIINIICMVFFVILVFYGSSITLQVSHQDTSSLPLSMSVPYSAIAVGGVLLFLNATANLLELLNKERGDE